MTVKELKEKILSNSTEDLYVIVTDHRHYDYFNRVTLDTGYCISDIYEPNTQYRQFYTKEEFGTRYKEYMYLTNEDYLTTFVTLHCTNLLHKLQDSMRTHELLSQLEQFDENLEIMVNYGGSTQDKYDLSPLRRISYHGWIEELGVNTGFLFTATGDPRKTFDIQKLKTVYNYKSYFNCIKQILTDSPDVRTTLIKQEANQVTDSIEIQDLLDYTITIKPYDIYGTHDYLGMIRFNVEVLDRNNKLYAYFPIWLPNEELPEEEMVSIVDKKLNEKLSLIRIS